MLDKKEVKKELDKLIQIREEIYAYLDANLEKDEKTGIYDFSSNPSLDAKGVYGHFFKLDYQARKLRGFLVATYGLKAE
ncbi:MAG: hypothetical protein CR967_01840 [Proteobacteria bacterium]|nr:MAG: hypothetical protein CR967_01840 [Pseudomonadota bacterium]